MNEIEQNVTNVAIIGAAGRMGQRLCALSVETQGLNLTEAIEAPGHMMIGKKATDGSDVVISDRMAGQSQVLIDFTLPHALESNLKQCLDYGVAPVIGTTGLKTEHFKLIDEAAKHLPILWAPNFSLGVNWLFALAAKTAKLLGDDYDIEILEAHHRFKKDAPSGTALGIANAICDATGKSLEKNVVYTRVGEDERVRGQITMQSLRMGDVVGEHTAFFSTLGERIELKHVATTRDTFARGALKVARWLSQKPAGQYQMKDFLGLDD